MNASTPAATPRLHIVSSLIEPTGPEVEVAALPVIVTAFASPDATQGAENACTWGDFVHLIRKDPTTFDPTTLPPAVGGKYAKPAALAGFSLAGFKDAYRSGANVRAVYAIGLDYDDKRCFDHVVEALRREGLEAVLHTTFNDTGNLRRFRVFVPLSRAVDATVYSAAWAHINALLGGGADENAKDAARFWYGPGIVAGRKFYSTHVEGRPFDVGALPAAPSAVPTRPVDTASGARDYATELAPHYAPAAAIVGAALRAQCPTAGQRHNVCAALAGALASKAFGPSSSDYPPPEQIAVFVRKAAEYAGFAALSNKYAYAADTVAKKRRGENVTGWPKLAASYPLVAKAVDDAFSPAASASASEGIAAAFGPPATSAANAPAPAADSAEADGDMFHPEILDLSFDPGPIEWAVERVFTLDSVNLLVAAPGSMKTWTLFSVAVAIAKGEPWLGRYVAKRRKVLIVDWESGSRRAIRRLRMLSPKDPPKDIHFLRNAGNLQQPEFWRKLQKTIEHLGIGVVLYDSLAAGSGGVDENSTEFAFPLQQAAHIDDVTHIFIHHAGKSEQKKNAIARGSSAIQAAVDSVYRFSDPEGTRQTAFTCQMMRAKDDDGEQEACIPLRLTDAEGLQYDGESKAAGLGDESFSQAILDLLKLAAASANDLAKALKKRKGDVLSEIKHLEAAGHVVCQNRKYAPDSERRRYGRVLVALSNGHRKQTVLCQQALVRKEDLAAFVTKGWLTRADNEFLASAQLPAGVGLQDLGLSEVDMQAVLQMIPRPFEPPQ
jgi:hypothetical protein